MLRRLPDPPGSDELLVAFELHSVELRSSLSETGLDVLHMLLEAREEAE